MIGIEKSERLKHLADLVRQVPCRRLVDIGSDHASVPIALVKEASCASVLVTDIRQGPLSVASRRAAKAGLGPEFQTRQTDGLDGLELIEGDVLLISGLGGDVIAGILEGSPGQVLIPKRLIVQPQTKEEVVRSALVKAGLALSDEQLVLDRNRLYLVMISDREDSKGRQLNPLEIFFGPVLLSRLVKQEGDPLLLRYLGKRIRRLKKRAPYDRVSAGLLQAFEERFPISYNELDQD